MNIAKILRAPIFKKICKQLLLQFLLLTVKISQRLPSSLNSISLFFSRSSSKFKKFSLGCSVVDSSLIRKKRRISRNSHSLSSLVVIRCHWLYHSLSFLVTRCHSLSPVTPLVVTRCHSLSLVISLVVILCHSSSLDVPLVCLFINDHTETPLSNTGN